MPGDFGGPWWLHAAPQETQAAFLLFGKRNTPKLSEPLKELSPAKDSNHPSPPPPPEYSLDSRHKKKKTLLRRRRSLGRNRENGVLLLFLP